MKKLVFLLFMLIFAASTTTFVSCSRKSGCPAYDSAKAQTNRKGELSTKRGKSSLFPKDLNRRG
ncbi:MAG: hypothetical protein SFU99_16825 [Saprospiraceae bacterium]|nr:hypothetical protein [Saprospiraceae bacterium]